MVLYKQVNGERVKLSVSEEAALRAGWKKSESDSREVEIEDKRKDERKAALHISITQKLIALGFTSDEIEFLL